MTNIAYFDAGGRLLGIQSVRTRPADAVHEEEVEPGTDPNSLLFDPVAGKVVKRPNPSFDRLTVKADGHSEATMKDLPIPCIVTIDGDEHEVSDGVLKLTFSTPGRYRVAVTQWPVVPVFQEIEAI
ncbi:hypothetical protein [Niveispirillum sp. KHB5.9]|uniref:hypothetical protein n=1 Tax=Niveispirillum sp. KHB5.9 TaxID=3400269 RepID=UPI003A85C7F8